MQLSRIIRDEMLPHMSVRTARILLLVELLSSVIEDVVEDARQFTARLFTAINIQGECQGLAWSENGNLPIPCRFLDSVARLACHEGRLAMELLTITNTISERWSVKLAELSSNSGWSMLVQKPTKSNYYLYYQYRIARATAYHLVAAPLHRGLCIKARQLLDAADEQLAQHLDGYGGWTVRVALAIPQNAVRETLSDYQPYELDDIFYQTIQNMQKSIGGGKLARSSLDTLMSDFVSAFYGQARDRNFFTRDVQDYRALIEDWVEPEALPARSPDLEKSDHLALQQYLRELDELDEDEKVDKWKEQKKGNFPPDAGRAVLVANPTACMPGVLPRVILAWLFDDETYTQISPNVLGEYARRAFVSLLLHLGRPAEWLLGMKLGRKPVSVFDCTEPIYDLAQHSIYYSPEAYIGWPDRFIPTESNAQLLSEIMQRHDEIYEPISLVHQIILPPFLAQRMDVYLRERGAFLEQNPLFASGCRRDAGPVWVDLRAGRIKIWNKRSLSTLMKSITDVIACRVGEFPNIRPAHFTRSFQGYYADLGLRNEYRYYISGRLGYWTNMPLRYTHVSSMQVADAHAAATKQLEAMIQDEQLALGIKPPTYFDLSQKGLKTTGQVNIQFGSWRTIRFDVLVHILEYLHSCINKTASASSSMVSEISKWNAMIEWVLVAISLLTGIRPFELVSIRPQHIDLEAGWISLQGKARAGIPAFRRIPILPELTPFLLKIQAEARRHKSKYLFGFYDAAGIWCSFETGSLEEILCRASAYLRLKDSPDFYSLRHRFKSDFMVAGLCELYLNYMLGHESRGTEAYNIYLDRSMAGLADAYFDACRQVAARYGIFNDGGIHGETII